MSTSDESILSQRLRLWSMSPTFLLASMADDEQAAARELQAALSGEWLDEKDLQALRLGDLRNDPAARPWLLRAIVETATNQMVGHIGFHTRPNPDYLQELCLGAVEIGYTIYSPYRRRGFAREATLAMFRWASETHAVRDFIASCSPQNEPSLRLLAKLGFERIGGHLDEVDGPEDIFRLRWDASQNASTSVH